jgi:plastocyanin
MATAFAASITVEVRDNCFRSLQNGSGGNAGVFANYARDTLGVGGTVTWLWTGQGHNVTAAFGSGLMLPPVLPCFQTGNRVA